MGATKKKTIVRLCKKNGQLAVHLTKKSIPTTSKTDLIQEEGEEWEEEYGNDGEEGEKWEEGWVEEEEERKEGVGEEEEDDDDGEEEDGDDGEEGGEEEEEGEWEK